MASRLPSGAYVANRTGLSDSIVSGPPADGMVMARWLPSPSRDDTMRIVRPSGDQARGRVNRGYQVSRRALLPSAIDTQTALPRT